MSQRAASGDQRTIVWFREHDLRVGDHVPLLDAARDRELVPLFVLDPATFGRDSAEQNAHRLQFLLESIADLDQSLRRRGSGLLLARGKTGRVVADVATAFRADRVLVHGLSDPRGRDAERAVERALGSTLRRYPGQTLHGLGTLRTGSDKPYSVFTPFARAFRERVTVDTTRALPKRLPPLPKGSLDLIRHTTSALPTLPELGHEANTALLPGGERAGLARLRRFLTRAPSYAALRDRTDEHGTSRLSADLAFGTLSPRHVWREIADSCGGTALLRFQDQLLWREFTHSTLWERPDLLRSPFNGEFTDFPWREDPGGFAAWQQGRTGYPMVDAAARQLLQEGFVHNRARMIAASFLSKQLLLPYTLGEKHYLRWLTDADVAQNNAGWQWCAGTGCSAQPFFRILNPVIQGKKFDPEGHYVRRYVPELSGLSRRFIHEPWNAPEDELRAAGIDPGVSYPAPIVDHRAARERALLTARQHFRSGYVAPITPGSTAA